MMITCK